MTTGAAEGEPTGEQEVVVAAETGRRQGEGAAEVVEPFPAEAVNGSLGERFVAIAARYPTSVALRSPSGEWTYAEMADRVERMAAALVQRLGSDTARSVAVIAEHDGPLVIAILAVIHSGHVVVVVDPTAPLEQLRGMLSESRSALLLHDEACAETASQLVSRAEDAVALDDLDAAPTALPSRGASSPAMLAFTSGTSGVPKAAVITHGLLLNLVRGATNTLRIGPADRMPMLFPTSMAVAAYPLFLPILNGGTLCTLDVRGVGFAPIGAFFEDEAITVAYLAPTVVRFLVDSLGGRSFPALRMVALGGEGIDADAVELTRRLFSPTSIGIGYGTTETGVVSLAVLPGDQPSPDEVSCGHAVPDVELFVLDDGGAVAAPGDVGEVAVAGPHLFDGYLGHPELDALVISDDPRGRDGWRLYRTGDHGVLDRHGALVIKGRVETRAKVRGRFVVLGDVEATLNGLDEVAASAVVAVSRSGITELVAYVVASAGTFDPTQVRATLLRDHEAYRVPTRWVVLDELPLLPNGKTDRRALPSLEDVGAAARPSRTSAPSWSRDVDTERIRAELLAIWQELLPVEVGLDDDFAHLGGDSLLAAQMLIVVEQRLGVVVPMGELIHARTVRDLTSVVRRLGGRSGESSTAACVQAGDESERPRLWFVHDLQGSAYRVRHLAAALGPDQPVWSFESPLLRGEPNRFGSLEQFAATYVADLLEVQPEGPYWLGGYSFGGVCAYEMARQLVDRGHRVEFLGVVDVGPGYRGPGWHARRSPFRPWFGVAKPADAGSSLSQRARHYVDMARSGPGRLGRHLMVRSGLARVVDPIRFRSDLATHGRVRPAWRLWYAWEEHWRLAAGAWDRASAYDGAVDLFWADQTPSADATLGWGALVRDLRIHRFDGDHMGVLEPRGAEHLGRVLRRVLDEHLVTGGRSSSGSRSGDPAGD